MSQPRVKEVHHLSKYLMFPFLKGKVTRETFEPIMEKISFLERKNP